MNREDFTEIFSQNIQLLGERGRFFAALVYSGVEGSFPSQSASVAALATIPVGQGFKLVVSKNERSISSFVERGVARKVRALSSSFSIFPAIAKDKGFMLSDIIFSRGEEEILRVSNDTELAMQLYTGSSAKPHLVLTFAGFSLDKTRIWVTIGMEFTFINYAPEAGSLIYDLVSKILQDSALYRDMYLSFTAKRDDNWVAGTNPVIVDLIFNESTALAEGLSAYFGERSTFRPAGTRKIRFSSREGTWGEISLLEGKTSITFLSENATGFGIHLIDVMRRLAYNAG